ncbi:unnamed protein product [Auanema sp. JU1783]|nr:unnamed protein product [Auanema sp. JU1783]
MGRNLLYDEIGEYRIKLMNRSSPLPKHIVDNELHPISRKRYLELQTIMRKNKESYKNNTVSSLSVSRLLNKRIQSDCSRQKYCSSKDLKRKHQTLSTIEEDTE